MSQIIKRSSGSGPSPDDLHVARFIVSAGGVTDGANYSYEFRRHYERFS